MSTVWLSPEGSMLIAALSASVARFDYNLLGIVNLRTLRYNFVLSDRRLEHCLSHDTP